MHVTARGPPYACCSRLNASKQAIITDPDQKQDVPSGNGAALDVKNPPADPNKLADDNLAKKNRRRRGPRRGHAKHASKTGSSADEPQKPAEELEGAESTVPDGQENEKASKPKPAKSRKRSTVSQRRVELEQARKKYTSVQIDPETTQLFITPSDPDFAFPLAVLDVDLIVPRHYPHQGDVRIKVNNIEIPRGNALNVEEGFSKTTGDLVKRLETLDANLESWLRKLPQKTITIIKPVVRPGRSRPDPDAIAEELATKRLTDSPSAAEEEKATKRPSKKDSGAGDDAGNHSANSAEETEKEYYWSSDDDFEPEIHSGSDSESGEDGAQRDGEPNRPIQRGTEIVLPNIKMENISLAEAVSLNILIKCGRCKHAHGFSNLMSAEYAHESKPRTEACERCGLGLMVAFRKEFVHSFCTTLGYMDISGGTAEDLLPSTYSALCGKCSEPGPLFKNIDFGRAVTQNCRNCHTKLTLTIDLFRFDVLTTDTLGKAHVVGKPSSGDKVRLTGGEPLPKDGACSHYRKSLRWFRFSCCRRVFPCDRCHDAELGHPAEAAMRMICGKCSREQRFNEICSFCHHSFTIRHSAFWEGGRGTRDQKRMSRKDPRKYKRIRPPPKPAAKAKAKPKAGTKAKS